MDRTYISDPSRLSALHDLKLLDTVPESGFDDIARLASILCNAPVALVSFVDEDRQRFKARVGFDKDQTDLESSVCAHGLRSPDLLVIPDLTTDERTRSNPLVMGEPSARFYAGAPLRTADGQPVGMLCVLDVTARPAGLTSEQAEALKLLATQVMTQLDLLASKNERLEQDIRYQQIVQSATDFGMIATDLQGRVTEWNVGAENVLGWSSEDMKGRTVERIFTPEDNELHIAQREMSNARELGRATDERWHLRADGTRFWASGEMMPLLDLAQNHAGYLKILRDRTEQHLAGLALERAQHDLRIAQKAGGIGVFWVANDRVLHVSPEFCELYGLPSQETYPSEVFEKLVIADDAHLVSTAAERERGTAPLDVEYRIRRADTNELRWISRRGDFEFAGDGQPARFAGAARDITQQMLTRDAQARTDERYRTLFTSMQQGFAIVEMVFDDSGKAVDYRYVEANTAFGQQSGVDAIVGRTFREQHPGVEPARLELYAGVARTGRHARLMDHCALTGRWLDVSVIGIGEAGSPCVGVLISDITHQRESEHFQAAIVKLGDAVRDLVSPAEISMAACALLAETLKVSLVGYGVADQEAETVFVERGWSEPGVPPLEGLLHFRDYGSHVEDLKAGRTAIVHDARLDPRTRDNAEALIERAARAFVNTPIMERGQFVALFYVSDKGARNWKNSELSLIREFGERTRVATERAQADLQRTEQAERLASMNANLERLVQERTEDRNALWQLSRDVMLRAQFDGVVTAVNPAWKDVLGWSEQDLIGHSLLDLVHPDDMVRTIEGAEELSRGISHARFDNRYRTRDGSYRWISWTTRSADGLINAVGRDVTEEREATEALQRSEAALRQSQKMEAVGQLTGGLAHDFNNLLAGIVGALDLMSIRVRQGRIQDLERYITTAQGASKRAAALTHRLLAFARRQTLDPKPTDVNKLIEHMEELLRRTIGPEIALQVEAGEETWPTLIDPPQLENALLNLCINARDAMPDGGRITVATTNKVLDKKTAQVWDVPPGQYVSLCVTDTGTGMPPDVIAKAFDPFFTTKPLGQGTGLGLSMIYGFVRQSGGHIRVHSQVGQGTTMCLYLPRHAGHAEAADQPTELVLEPAADGNQTVLVVDDEPTVRMLVTEVLQDVGYRILEAADIPGGLRILDSDMKIDLLVTDVGLPGGMNGRQMADAARVRRPDLKVLFITGYAESTVLRNGSGDEGVEVMTKPFAIDAFASRIRDLLK